MNNFKYTRPNGFISNYNYLLYLSINGAIKLECSTANVPNILPALRRELLKIREGHLEDYFLIWHDLMQFCKEQNIQLYPINKNNSVVCHCLGLTAKNPLVDGEPHKVDSFIRMDVQMTDYAKIKEFVKNHFAEANADVSLQQLGIGLAVKYTWRGKNVKLFF